MVQENRIIIIMNCEKIVRELIASLEHSDIGINSLGFTNYLESFRTVGLIVPRQSSKTSVLLKLFNEYSALMFVHNKHYTPPNGLFTDGVLKYSELPLTDRFIGISNSGNLKYQCFLLDDYLFMSDIQRMHMNKLLVLLKCRNMLTKDFFILKLTT